MHIKMYFFKSIVKTYPEELAEVEGCGLWGAMGTGGSATAGLRGILEGVGLLLLLLSPSVLLIAVKQTTENFPILKHNKF